MFISINRRLRVKVILVIALISSSVVLIFQLRNINPKLLIYGDFIQYWSAGRLFIDRDNPYDFDKVVELKISQGKSEFSEEYISPMLYPPWILPILLPFSLNNYDISRLIWLFFHIIIIFFTSRILWNIYSGVKNIEWLSYLLVFTFTPTLYILGLGHITTLHILGITLFIFFTQVRAQRFKNDFFAGIFLSLIFYKPHLLLVFFLIVLLWTFNQKRWGIVIGSIVFLSANTLIAILFKSDVYLLYLNSIIKYPIGVWATPTFGMVLRLIFGYDREWLQLLPPLFGIIFAYIYWRKYRNYWNWLDNSPTLIMISITFSLYIWIYDMVILVIPLIYIFSRFINRKSTYPLIFISATYLLINISAFYINMSNYDYILFWFSPILFVWFLFWDWFLLNRSADTMLKT